jgi:hypothetical protein
MCIGCEGYPPELNELGKTIDNYFPVVLTIFFIVWVIIFLYHYRKVIIQGEKDGN